MAQQKIVSSYSGGKTITNYLPCTDAQAADFADTFLNTKSVVESATSVAGSSTGFASAILTKVSLKDTSTGASVSFSFYMKSTKSEADVRSALLGTSFVNNGVTVNCDEVNITGMRVVSFS